MAGANNAQFKALGYKARDIAKRRAEHGRLTIEIMEKNDAPLKRAGFAKGDIAKLRTDRPSPPPGWRAAAAKSASKGAAVNLGKAKSSDVPAGSPLNRKAFEPKDIRSLRDRAAARSAQPPAGWQSAARKATVAKGAPGWNAAAKKAASTKTGAPGWKGAAARAAAKKGVSMTAKLTPGNYTWKRGADGNYSASDGRAKLEKTGKSWALVMRDGSRHPLGKKASFDHAEQAMARLGAR